MYNLNQSQTLFSPSLQQVSSNIFRGSCNPFRQFERRATRNGSHLPSTSNLQVEDFTLPETARQIAKIPRKQLTALLDEVLAPGFKLFYWIEGKCRLEDMILPASSIESLGSSRKAVSKNEVKLSLGQQALRKSTETIKPSDVSIPRLRLQRLYGNPQLQLSRGFKTKRSDGYSLPFQIKVARENDSKNVSIDPNLIASTLKQLNTSLTLDEREKLNAAIHGYLLGKNEASKGGQIPAQATVVGKAETNTKQDEITFKKGDVWNKLNKVATVLVIIAITLSLGQIFNIPFLRINRGNNEIAPEEIEVTFDDVKGCDEAKQELQEMVEFLMHPEKFSALGGKLPKGCLLVGPPGTGKTLLARAVAGQAGVPFFHAAGSEFDEVLVGQGARRVRDLFRAAKSRAPCVIFIDEIDSVGSKRTNSVLHPYANQTINQLLSEMDGFLPNEGVVVLGATNRAEDLDKALLRPGRFDTQVVVPIPDMNGRKEILTLYLGKIKHDNSVDVDKLAKMTVGFSGADLENMVNTAAIRAAIEDKSFVTMSEFEYSHDKHVLGTDWKSRVRDKEDLKITAYHEAGHTLVAFFTEGSKPLHKVTIVAKGMTGGHTAFLPEKDSYHETKLQYLAQMDVAMGGRAAEELIFNKDNVTGGASHDLEQATYLAEVMVKKLGMSEKIGLRVIPDNQGFSKNNDLGPGTYEQIDSEVTRMLNESYKRAIVLLKTHRKELDLLAEALLNYETLDVEDVKAIVGGDQKSVSEKMAASSRTLQSNRGGSKPTQGQTPQITGKPDVLTNSTSRLEA